MSLLGGRFITTHGFVTHDPFPTIAGARTWLNQQWLSQVAFYTPDLLGAVMRLQIGAVIAHVPAAIARLERIGFRAEFTAPGGIYLVRQEMRGA